jgi:hypothetical protein
MNTDKTLIWNRKFEYPTSTRALINGKQSLANWKARMGDRQADRIRDISAMRGTAMHRFLEAYIDGSGHKDLTSIGKEAEPMAKKIIESGLGELEEVWGQEVTLYYPDLYAGATDIVGVYGGNEAIIDFKQTNKPKRREWITDYFCQLGGYAMAHNHVYQTKIQSGVILMCSKDLLFQRFEVSGKEFVDYQHQFLKRVDQYYANVPDNKEGEDTKND